jgi:nitroreductase
METWDALRARRNVRQFLERPIPAEALDRILDAGRRAPSAGNWQPWDFVVVTEREQLAELAKVWQGARHVAGAFRRSTSWPASCRPATRLTSRWRHRAARPTALRRGRAPRPLVNLVGGHEVGSPP